MKIKQRFAAPKMTPVHDANAGQVSRRAESNQKPKPTQFPHFYSLCHKNVFNESQ